MPPQPFSEILDKGLANNGGPTRTHVLVAGSPTVDAINDGTCPPPGKDQRDVITPQDGSGDGGPTCGIGAYEYVFTCIHRKRAGPSITGISNTAAGNAKAHTTRSGDYRICTTSACARTCDTSAFYCGLPARLKCSAKSWAGAWIITLVVTLCRHAAPALLLSDK